MGFRTCNISVRINLPLTRVNTNVQDRKIAIAESAFIKINLILKIIVKVWRLRLHLHLNWSPVNHLKIMMLIVSTLYLDNLIVINKKNIFMISLKFESSKFF